MFHEHNQNIVQTYRPNHLGVPIGKVLKSTGNKLFIKLFSDLACGDGIRIIGEEDNGCIVTSIFMNNDRVKYGMPWDIVKFLIKIMSLLEVKY